MDDELRAYLDQHLGPVRDQLTGFQEQLTGVQKQLTRFQDQFVAYQDRQQVYLEKQFSRIDDQFRAVDEKIEATETRLLTEFHKWARTYEIRMRAVSTQTRFFEERLDAIEDRVANLEKKP